MIIGLTLILLLSFARFESRETAGFLRVSDQEVLDGAGDPLVLKGFNIAFKDFDGTLGEKDIKRITDSGANSIRLVIDYRQLESSPFEYDAKNFGLLDTIVSWCDKYGIYLILDMHLAPGIQNPHDFVVHREKSYRFWEESQYQERFYALWTAIAKRYADRKIIAAYDLLNEGVAPDETQYLKVINTVADKVRQYDKHHILIVEEALLPNGTKRIFPIADDNVIYSIHFFYPPQFTFYTTTRQRTITRYPGEMSINGEAIGAVKSQAATGTRDWRRLTLRGAPPEGAEIVQVLILSDEQHGRVWFDDIHLEVDGRAVDLPAPLVSNSSFEIDYPGISWETRGPCGQVTEVTAKKGRHSIGFANCTKPAVVLSSPIAVDGDSYTLSAWVKTADAQGGNQLALSWHKLKTLTAFNKITLRDRLDYALRFKAWHGAPVYVGEFTVHENPSTDSVSNYMKDILDIMETEGLHWSYWTYYSEFPGIGIYTGSRAYLARPDSLRILARNMRPPG
jgi:aryl-phospho-beta-D-glucosidase BglC (GH1 family)